MTDFRGRRYEICLSCKLKWYVHDRPVPKSGFICPVCREKEGKHGSEKAGNK